MEVAIANSDNDREVVKLLLADSSPISDLLVFLYPRTNRTLLMTAAKYGRLKISQCLLKMIPNCVNVKNTKGFTALHYACFAGEMTIARLLLMYGADLSLTNSYGETAAGAAIAGKQMDIAKMITLEMIDPGSSYREREEVFRSYLIPILEDKEREEKSLPLVGSMGRWTGSEKEDGEEEEERDCGWREETDNRDSFRKRGGPLKSGRNERGFEELERDEDEEGEKVEDRTRREDTYEVYEDGDDDFSVDGESAVFPSSSSSVKSNDDNSVAYSSCYPPRLASIKVVAVEDGANSDLIGCEYFIPPPSFLHSEDLLSIDSMARFDESKDGKVKEEGRSKKSDKREREKRRKEREEEEEERRRKKSGKTFHINPKVTNDPTTSARVYEIDIGRSRSCQLQCDDLSVSKRHAAIFYDDSRVYTLIDLNSKHGTSLNGVKLTLSGVAGQGDASVTTTVAEATSAAAADGSHHPYSDKPFREVKQADSESDEDWIACKTDDGRVYYYHRVTRESVWQKPVRHDRAENDSVGASASGGRFPLEEGEEPEVGEVASAEEAASDGDSPIATTKVNPLPREGEAEICRSEGVHPSCIVGSSVHIESTQNFSEYQKVSSSSSPSSPLSCAMIYHGCQIQIGRVLLLCLFTDDSQAQTQAMTPSNQSNPGPKQGPVLSGGFQLNPKLGEELLSVVTNSHTVKSKQQVEEERELARLKTEIQISQYQEGYRKYQNYLSTLPLSESERADNVSVSRGVQLALLKRQREEDIAREEQNEVETFQRTCKIGASLYSKLGGGEKKKISNRDESASLNHQPIKVIDVTDHTKVVVDMDERKKDSAMGRVIKLERREERAGLGRVDLSIGAAVDGSRAVLDQRARARMITYDRFDRISKGGEGLG